METVTDVLVSTDQMPQLGTWIATRREVGLDTYDEWREGVYRIVTGPKPEHGELVLEVGMLLRVPARAAGLLVAAPVNIGRDKVDARVPDLAVFRPDTPRTSEAYLGTAELVVEILSPGEIAGDKLPFYATWGVREYVEFDLDRRSVRWLSNVDGRWVDVAHSRVLNVSVASIVDAVVWPG